MRAARYRLRFASGVNIAGATYGSGQYGSQTYGQQASDPLASRFYSPMPWPAGATVSPSWLYRQGDTEPDFDCQVRSPEGVMDFTPVVSATLVLTGPGLDDHHPYPLTIGAPGSGRLTRQWLPGDLAEPGVYRAAVVLTFSSTRKLTLPFDDRHTFIVNAVEAVVVA